MNSTVWEFGKYPIEHVFFGWRVNEKRPWSSVLISFLWDSSRPLTHKHTLFNHSILLYSKSERKLFDSEMKVEELSNEHALRCRVKRKQNPKILQAAVACVSEFHPGFWGKSELQFSFNSIRHPFGRVNLFPFVSSLWLSWYKLLSLGH